MSTDPKEIARRDSASPICRVLQAIADIMRDDPMFARPEPEMTILTEDKGDIDTTIAQKVGALGLAVTVMFSAANAAKESLGGPVFDNVVFIVEICEKALTNRQAGGVTSLELAEHAARILHLAKLPQGRILRVETIRPYPNPPAPADVCYHVICKTSQFSIARKEQ